MERSIYIVMHKIKLEGSEYISPVVAFYNLHEARLHCDKFNNDRDENEGEYIVEDCPLA